MADFDGEPTLAALIHERNYLERDIADIKKYHGEKSNQKETRLKDVKKLIKDWGKDPKVEARVY